MPRASLSLSRVCIPTTPSSSRPCSRWNSRTRVCNAAGEAGTGQGLRLAVETANSVATWATTGLLSPSARGRLNPSGGRHNRL